MIDGVSAGHLTHAVYELFADLMQRGPVNNLNCNCIDNVNLK